MAEQDIHRHTADVKEEETQSTDGDQHPTSDEYKQEETDIALNVKHSEDGDSAEEMVPLAAGSSLDEASMLTVEDNSSPLPVDEGSHGDYNRPAPRKEQPTMTAEEVSREYNSGERKAPQTASPLTLDDTERDQADGPHARPKEETAGINVTESEGGEDDGSDLDIQEYTVSPQTALPKEVSDEEETDEQRENIETIGPTTQEPAELAVPAVTESPGGSSRFSVAVGLVVVVAIAILVQHLLQPEPQPQTKDVRQIDIFLRKMEKLKTVFPNQRAELWSRSRIHLLRHLQTAQPTEPVSLILTAGVRAEKTLHCLAQGLASAFSASLNASILQIDGVSKASQDSDDVKLDIDRQLQGAFEGDKPVAIIHRFEELPPGSTLIFYRYCDHENAAYKKTCLIFTVLLEEQEEIPAKSRLSTVEEMVDDHLQKKFLSAEHPVSFDRMDLDKYGGLWSRISHLILPVTGEERMEHEGC